MYPVLGYHHVCWRPGVAVGGFRHVDSLGLPAGGLPGEAGKRVAKVTERDGLGGGMSSTGGARAATGVQFQAEVFAWWAARAVANVAPGMGLRPDTRIVAVGCETDLPVDDVGVVLSDDGLILVQAKYGMRGLDSRRDDVVKAVDQLVDAFRRGLPTTTSLRPVDVLRDRLVIATDVSSSKAFMHLRKVLNRLRGQPDSQPISSAARSLQERDAWIKFSDIVENSWLRATGSGFPQEELRRRFYSVVVVDCLDFAHDIGKDAARARELLSNAGATKPLAELVNIGIVTAAKRQWHKRDHLAAIVGVAPNVPSQIAPESTPQVAHTRVSDTHPSRPRNVVRVLDARPRLLGVHAAIHLDEAGQGQAIDDLPVYVPRDIDDKLRAAIGIAGEGGGFVLLIGGSSVGKTRSLFEAVKSVFPEWWLLYPSDAQELREFASAPTPLTIVWLDGLQRYVEHSDGLSAGTVRNLIDARVVVVGTLWRDEYHARLAQRGQNQQGYEDSRVLLNLATVMSVPEDLSKKERQLAESLTESDRRILVALGDRSAGFTQILSAGPELINHWEQAADRNCYGRAVITAALDARRVGAWAPLTRDYLEAAAPGYLTSAQQAVAPRDWLDQALDYATELKRGAASTLSPIAADMGKIAGYMVADYLYQHAFRARRTEALPNSVWRAIVEHHDKNETVRLADSAFRRNRISEAEALYRQVNGSASHVAQSLARLLVVQSRDDEAIDVLKPYAGSGDNFSTTFELVKLLARHGRLEELAKLAGANDWIANELSKSQANNLIREGRISEALDIFRRHVDSDDLDISEYWEPVDLLVERGWIDEAKQILALQADAGNSFASKRLAKLLKDQRSFDELYDRAVGDPFFAAEMAELDARHRRTDKIIQILRAHVNQGEMVAGMALAKLLSGQGRLDEAAEIEGQVYNNSTFSAGHRARLLLAQGRMDELYDLIYAGDFIAVRIVAEFGAVDLAIALLLDLAYNHGVWFANGTLVDLLIEYDRIDELRAEVFAGTPGAAEALRQMRDLHTQGQ